MKTLYFDLSMGAAGDMLTAALLELHPERETFLKKLNRALDGKAVVSAEPDMKCGIMGTRVRVLINGEEEGNEHHYQHGMSVSDVLNFYISLDIPEKVKSDALNVYKLIADAESAVHGRPVEEIHFHEVGTLDALADVLAVCWLMHDIGAEKICASEVNVGSGTVKCAHGILPVPAPATALILRDVPVYSGLVKSELCTPTGAALLKYFVQEFGPMPAMRMESVGIGTGHKSFEQANIVRAVLGESSNQAQSVVELACNIDDMTAEELGFAMDVLLDSGALDVFFTDIGMKKCRPATMLSCLCRAADEQKMLELIFKHTRLLGVREYKCARFALNRSFEKKQTSLGEVTLKRAQGFGTAKSKVEFEDLAAIAREKGMSLREVSDTILKEI